MSTTPSSSETSKASLESGPQQKQENESKDTNEQSSNKDGDTDDSELEYDCPKVPPLKRGDRFYRWCHRDPAEFNCFIEERGEVPGVPIQSGGASLLTDNGYVDFEVEFRSTVRENFIEQKGPQRYYVKYNGGKAWTLPIDIKGLSPIVLRALEPDIRVLTLYDPVGYGLYVTKEDFKAFLKTPTAKALNATLDRAYPKRERVSFRKTNRTYFKSY